MKLSEMWFGKQAEPATQVAAFHDTTLEALRVATQVQQASSIYEWTMRVAAVYRGAQILSDLAAQLPWFAVEGGRHSGQQLQAGAPERSNPQPAILLRPDPFVTRGEWIRQVVLSLIFDGNAYLFKSGVVDGVPASVQVLTPGAMSVNWNKTETQRLYSYKGTGIPSSSIDHLALNRSPGQPKGVGPIGAISLTIAGQIAADKFARDLFTDGGIPTGMLEYPGKLTETEAKELLKVWNAAQDETRKTAVLSGGTTYSAISLSPDQAQMLQSRSFGVSEIARALGIPAHLLNAATGVAGASGASMTYTNTQDIFRELLKTTLFPVYLERISEVASMWLPRGKSVHFDDRELLRADTPSRYNAHKVALDAGFLTVDEVREAEGLPPSPELEAEKAEKRAIAEKISGGGDTSEGSPADDDDRAKSNAE